MSMDKYEDLVQFILYSYDTVEKLNSPLDHTRGQVDGLRSILHWLEGREGTDLEGLREKYKKH